MLVIAGQAEMEWKDMRAVTKHPPPAPTFKSLLTKALHPENANKIDFKA